MNAAVRILMLSGIVFSLVATSGCATIVKGSSQELTITTDPAGAACDLRKGGSSVGRVDPTPGTVQVKKGDGNIEVSCKKNGYADTAGTILSSLEGWTFGNILFGGVIGVVVDASSGALHNYQPDIFVKLPPEKFTSDVEREDFYDTWRNQILQNSTKAKIEAAKTCSKEQCDEVVKRIDRETEQALAGIEANRNLRKGASPAVAEPPAASPQAGQPAPIRVANTDGTNSKSGRWHPSRGDRWKYRMVDGKRNVGTVNIEVVESSDSRVSERITKDGSPGFSIEREVRPEFSTNAFVPSVSLPGGYKFLELSAYFPPESSLAPGQKLGQISGDLELLAVGRRNLAWDTRIVGQERIRVPAGEFDAWKIEAVANEVTVHGPLRITYNVWYSQAVQRAVKISLSFNTRIDIANSSESLELAGFEKTQ